MTATTPRLELCLVLSLGLLAGACSGGSQANMSVSAGSTTARATATTTSTPSASASLDLGNGISLDRIRFVIRRLKLEGQASSGASSSTTPDTLIASGSTSTADHGGSSGSSGSSGTSGSSGQPVTRDGGDDGKTEVEHEQDDGQEPTVGPLLADLQASALSAGLQQLFQGAVPSGTFHELKIAIGPVGVADTNGNAALAELARQNASIVVDGTIDGRSFSFVSGLVVEVDVEGDIVLSADKSNNITVSIDPTTWFGGSGAARLDPTDAASKARIEDNIKRSIRGFQDDDRRGDDDHGGTGGGNDGATHT